MTNLVATYLPGDWRSDGLMAALTICSKLEHLAFNDFTEIDLERDISKPLYSNLSCLTAYGQISDDTIKEMTSLKHIFYDHGFSGRTTLDQLTTLLNNGLVGLDTTIKYEHLESLCQLGSRLEHLSMSFQDHQSGVTLPSSCDVREIVSSMRRL